MEIIWDEFESFGFSLDDSVHRVTIPTNVQLTFIYSTMIQRSNTHTTAAYSAANGTTANFQNLWPNKIIKQSHLRTNWMESVTFISEASGAYSEVSAYEIGCSCGKYWMGFASCNITGCRHWKLWGESILKYQTHTILCSMLSLERIEIVVLDTDSLNCLLLFISVGCHLHG
jgi:hypothetical protein